MAAGPVSRNAPCPCGSGKKYKHCHMGQPLGSPRLRRLFAGATIAGVLGVAWLVANLSGWRTGGFTALGGIALVALYLVLRNPPPPTGRSGHARIDFGK